MSLNLLIVGLGSVGCRHAQNFLDLGYSVLGVDPSNDKRSYALKKGWVKDAFPTIEGSLDLVADTLAGAVICSPTYFHPSQIVKCAELGLPVLSEKPIGASLEDVSEISSNGAIDLDRILVGYTWRWWPALIKLKKVIDSGCIGKVHFAQFLISAHLADWHPWEDYREFFMSSKALGGGALLDESHWIDQMIWFFGEPESVFGRSEKVSDLEITSDDAVDALITYAHGPTVSLHLDIYGRPHQKTIQMIGSEGAVYWSEAKNQLCVTRVNQLEEIFDFSEERNHMFIGVARDFDRLIKGESIDSCSWNDGVRVLRVVEAIRESTQMNTPVSLRRIDI